MILFPVVSRELSVISRQRSTYRLRVAASGLALAAMAWLLFFSVSQVTQADQGRSLFEFLTLGTFLYCLLAGARATADCLSAEKREGTLGLLFLTDLKGFDIVFGKVVSSSINCVYGLVAIVPILSLAILLGGVTATDVGRAVLVLLNTLFFSLSVGVFVSTISQNERKAMFGTVAIILFFLATPYFVLGLLETSTKSGVVWEYDQPFMEFSPAYSFRLIRPSPGPVWKGDLFFRALGVNHILGWLFLLLASVRLPYTYQIRTPNRLRSNFDKLWCRLTYGSVDTRKQHRARLLDQNAFTWLAAREPVKKKCVWGFVFSMAAIWSISAYNFGDMLLSGITVICLILVTHGFLKAWLASEICSRFVEDRRSGAIELLICTPLGVKNLLKGQWLAARHLFQAPVAVLIALELALLLAGLKAGRRDPNLSAVPHTLIYVAAFSTLLLDLWALRWVAAWHAIRARHVNRPLIVSLFQILILPWLIFLGVCGTFSISNIVMPRPSPSSQGLNYIIAWWGISLGISWYFGQRAKHRILNQFQEIAARPFSPKEEIPETAAPKPAPKLTPVKGNAPEESGVSLAERPAKLRFRWLWVSLCILGVIALGIIVRRQMINNRVAKRLAELAQAGVPVTRQSLYALFPPAPVGDNIADVVVEAGYQANLNLNRPSRAWLRLFWERDLPPVVQPIDPALLSEIARFTAANSNALQTLSRARRMRHSRFILDTRSLQQDIMWKMHSVRQLAGLVQAKGLLAIEQNTPAHAMEAVEILVAMAQGLGYEPNLYVQTIRTHLLLVVQGLLERKLAKTRLPDDFATSLDARLVEMERQAPEAFRNAIASDYYGGIEIYGWPPEKIAREIAQMTTPEQISRFKMMYALLNFTGKWQSDFLLFLNRLQPKGEMADAGRIHWAEFRLSDHLHYYAQSGETEQAIFLSRLRLLRLALALERYGERHDGALPEALNELVPEFIEKMPMDPYDEKPVRFKPLSDGYLLYCVGDDLQDNNGQAVAGKRKGGATDIVFKVQRFSPSSSR